jgi:monovalent cation:H+ antiporter-2, CPA2 family
MPQDSSLISTIVAALVLAFIFGAIANRLRLPPLVGYLVAGVLVGPFTPGFVADVELALELSEIGVILLMFGVGLNFSMKDLLSVQAVAIPGALGRIVGATLLGMGLAWLMGWPLFAGLIFGLALSVASTVVLLKALQDRHMIDSERGRLAVGWVIVEDIAMVLALVLIPAFAGISETEAIAADPFVAFVERIFNADIGLGGVIAITVLKLAAFVGFMFVVGRRVIPLILHFTAHTGSRELFRLAVLAIALGVAAGSAYLFGVSLALGAFFAGMILSESELSQRAAQESLPLRDAFAVLFFVSVGMLFNPMVFVTSPFPVIGVLLIILFFKTAIAFGLMLLFRQPAGMSLMVAVSLAQVGEFSFILAALGVGLGILPEEGRDLILSGALIAIILNPLMFWAGEKLRPAVETWLRHPPEDGVGHARVEPELVPSAAGTTASAEVETEEDLAEHQTALTGHTILAGYGRVGAVIGEGLLAAGIPFVLIEDAEGRVAAARASGVEVIEGNAATSRALALANVAEATTVIIAIPNAFEAGQATEQSRRLNPDVRIVARAHSDEEEGHLMHLGADAVVMGEREIGLGMLSLLHDERADVIADTLKNAEVPVHTKVPNPTPGSTSSLIDAAVTDETFAEEPASDMWADDARFASGAPGGPEIPAPPPSPIAPPVDPVPAPPQEVPPAPRPGNPQLPPELPPAEPQELPPAEPPPAPVEPVVPDPGPAEPPPAPPQPPAPEAAKWHEEALDPWGDRDADEPTLPLGRSNEIGPALSPVIDIDEDDQEEPAENETKP